MWKYLVKRLLQMAGVLLIVSTIVFFITSVIGNPIYNMLPERAPPEQVEQVRKMLGLDKPLYYQYAIFLRNALRGDFGMSYTHHQPALRLIFSRFPATLEIVIVAMLLTIVIGISGGVYAGAYPRRKLSKGIMGFSILGISLPSFWIGMVFIFFLSVRLGWFPVSGRGETGVFLGIRSSLFTLEGWRHVFLPAFTLAVINIATIIRLIRAGMMETLRQEYIKFARAKGVGEKDILFKHALKNIMIPVVTIFGLQLGELIAFTTITETIYAWPGMGKLLIDSIMNLDRPIVSAYLLFVSVLFVAINFAVDIIYTLIDPRVEL